MMFYAIPITVFMQSLISNGNLLVTIPPAPLSLLGAWSVSTSVSIFPGKKFPGKREGIKRPGIPGIPGFPA
jgi:hypothetical protein